MSVMSICDIKRYGTVLHLAREEREVYIIRSYKEGIIRKLANKRLKFIKLIFSKGLSSKFYRIIGLRTRLNYKDEVILAFVNIFN
jgi:hypothetical protein